MPFKEKRKRKLNEFKQLLNSYSSSGEEEDSQNESDDNDFEGMYLFLSF